MKFFAIVPSALFVFFFSVCSMASVGADKSKAPIPFETMGSFTGTLLVERGNKIRIETEEGAADLDAGQAATYTLEKESKGYFQAAIDWIKSVPYFYRHSLSNAQGTKLSYVNTTPVSRRISLTIRDSVEAALLEWGAHIGKETELKQEQVKKDCSYSGYCNDCGLGVDGKFDCKFKFKVNCSGSQKVEETVSYIESFTELNISTPNGQKAILRANTPKMIRKVHSSTNLSSCG